MEAGRRVDVATNLLSAKDVPYIVAAPLLIQDLKGWRRDGVQGLQQVLKGGRGWGCGGKEGRGRERKYNLCRG